jgi:ferredoxin
MSYYIVPEKCIMCDACRPVCPRNAISAAEVEKTYIIDSGLCNDCQNVSHVRCVPQCPVDAIAGPHAS